MRRTLLLGLSLGLVLPAFGCAQKKLLSLVVAEVRAERPLAAPLEVQIDVGPAEHRLGTHSFPLSGGLSGSPEKLGIYLPGTLSADPIEVSAKAVAGGCTYAASGQAQPDGVRRTATATLTLQPQGACAGGDGGVADGGADGPGPDGGVDAQPGVDVRADGGVDDAKMDGPQDTLTDGPSDTGSSPDVAAPRDASPDGVVTTQPPLKNCRTYTQDQVDPSCNIGAKPTDQAITSLAFSPDGKLLASANGFVVEVWNASATGLKVNDAKMIGTNTFVLAYSPDSKLLGAAGGNGEIEVWHPDWTSAFERLPFDPTVEYRWIGFAADNDRFFTAAALGNSLQVWSVTLDKLVANVPTSPIAAAAASPSPPAGGSWWVAVASSTGQVSFYDLNATGVTATKPFSVGSNVRSLALSPDATMLAVASSDGLTLWDVSTKDAPIRQMPDLTSSVLGNDFQVSAFAPSGRYLLATLPALGTVIVFDVAKRTQADSLGKQGQPQSIAWMPDGRGIAIGASCGVVYYCPN